MHVAFVHRRGFGQFAALAEHLATNGHDVSLICETVDRRLPSVRVISTEWSLVLAPMSRWPGTGYS